jgi:DNA polymerase-3 subunit delta'
MSSILLFGATEEARDARVLETLGDLEMEVSENNPDLLIIEPLEKKKSIGIKQVREATKFLVEKPFSHKAKVVLINKGELLTVQAQNALLKTLEEPPSYATIIVNAKTENSLLETVISRCRKIRVTDDTKRQITTISINEILTMRVGKRLEWSAEYSKEDKQHVINAIEDWIHQLRENLNLANAENIEVLLKVKGDLEKTNVSLKLALEYLSTKLKARS